jgi:hypothetical protein
MLTGVVVHPEGSMPALFWNNDRRIVGQESPAPLNDLRVVIAGKLPELGFTDIRRNKLEVAGSRPGCLLSIGHFAAGPGEFWEVVMCAGDDGETTRRGRDEVVQMLRSLKFF